eukprot:gene1695-1886_t
MAIKEELKGSSVIIEKIIEKDESMWMVINNNRIKVRIGLIYGPQESRTTTKEIETMYKRIEKQIIEAQSRNQRIIIVGDFNSKIGEIIKNNKKEVTKGGKKLIELIHRYNLTIVNSNKKTKGIWTRVQGEQKSVIDYCIIGKEDEHCIKRMEIDQQGISTPYRIVGNRTVYTDHRAITTDLDWTIAYKHSSEHSTGYTVSRAGSEKFRKETEKGQLEKIVKSHNTNLQLAYDQWLEELNNILKKCYSSTKKKRKYKGKNKTMRKLMKVKRDIRKELHENSAKEEEKSMLKQRDMLITEYLNNMNRQAYIKRVNETIKEIQKGGGINGQNFWEFKKKMDIRKKRKE